MRTNMRFNMPAPFAPAAAWLSSNESSELLSVTSVKVGLNILNHETGINQPARFMMRPKYVGEDLAVESELDL